MVKTSPEEIKRPEQLIYIGPNLPGGILQRYTVLKGGLPVYIAETVGKCPALKGLFVLVENFSTAEQSLSITGSEKNALFGQVVDYIKKGGK